MRELREREMKTQTVNSGTKAKNARFWLETKDGQPRSEKMSCADAIQAWYATRPSQRAQLLIKSEKVR